MQLNSNFLARYTHNFIRGKVLISEHYYLRFTKCSWIETLIVSVELQSRFFVFIEALNSEITEETGTRRKSPINNGTDKLPYNRRCLLFWSTRSYFPVYVLTYSDSVCYWLTIMIEPAQVAFESRLWEVLQSIRWHLLL